MLLSRLFHSEAGVQTHAESFNLIHVMDHVMFGLHHGRTDSLPASGDGSRLYDVNMWMWSFGRGMPRSESMSVSDAERLRAKYKSQRRSKGEKSKTRLREREQDDKF